MSDCSWTVPHVSELTPGPGSDLWVLAEQNKDPPAWPETYFNSIFASLIMGNASKLDCKHHHKLKEFPLEILK